MDTSDFWKETSHSLPPNRWDKLIKSLHDGLVDRMEKNLVSVDSKQHARDLNDEHIDYIDKKMQEEAKKLPPKPEGKGFDFGWIHEIRKAVTKLKLPNISLEQRKIREWFMDNLETDTIYLNRAPFIEKIAEKQEKTKENELLKIINEMKAKQWSREQQLLRNKEITKTALETLKELKQEAENRLIEKKEIREFAAANKYNATTTSDSCDLSGLSKNVFEEIKEKCNVGNELNETNFKMFTPSTFNNAVFAAEAPKALQKLLPDNFPFSDENFSNKVKEYEKELKQKQRDISEALENIPETESMAYGISNVSNKFML